MPEYNSPLGTKKFSGQPMREVDVSDDSGYSEQQVPDMNAIREFQSRMQPPQSRPSIEMEEEMRQAKLARRQGKERLSDGAKRRIEMLLGMTRLTRTVNIDDNVYVLQTLKSKELRAAIVASAEYDGTVQFSFETAKQILARSLVQIAGVAIEEFINSSELDDKLIFIEELDQSLLSRLYTEYSLLTKESTDKYSIKTDADVKEVVADLKK